VALHNRVTPFGQVVAVAARGLVYGNRGCLHDETGRIRRSYAGTRWIACRLEFKARRRRPLMRPGGFTELFFLDEATAFAAGHRPCAECRREDFNTFSEIWRAMHPGEIRVAAIDARLQRERIDEGTDARRLYDALLDELPDGAFVVDEGIAMLVRGDELLRWTPWGYTEAERRPRRRSVLLLTPPSLIEVLRAGWPSSMPLLHPTAARTQ